MVDQAGPVVWAVLGLPVLLLLASQVVRPVLPDRQVLVLRQGRVRRAVRRGLAVRVPLRDRFVPVDLGPATSTVLVRARTGDGFDAAVVLEAAWRGVPWRPGATYVPAEEALERVLCDRVVAEVATLGVEELPAGLEAGLGRVGAGLGVGGAALAGLELAGLELAGLELAAVDIVLRTDAHPHGSR